MARTMWEPDSREELGERGRSHSTKDPSGVLACAEEEGERVEPSASRDLSGGEGMVTAKLWAFLLNLSLGKAVWYRAFGFRADRVQVGYRPVSDEIDGGSVVSQSIKWSSSSDSRVCESIRQVIFRFRR